ncbi:MAG: bifunctional diguanylate cyclase/phosphodiesterase [Actinotalea sp.]|nr:bifunctional diguanylate cyclase/phosphodiesterase [Actinotalea sp.]
MTVPAPLPDGLVLSGDVMVAALALIVLAVLVPGLALVALLRERQHHRRAAGVGVSPSPAAATWDALTGLPRRGPLEVRLEQAHARARTTLGRLAVVVCDVERVHEVNRRHGRAGGDRLLRFVADHVVALAGPHAYVARTGGDQFTIVLEEPVTDADLLVLTRRLGAAAVGPHGERVRCCVGAAVWTPGQPTDATQLLADAELALGQARRTRRPGERAQATFYDATTRDRVDRRERLRRDLVDAVAHGDIVAVFQPVTDTTTLDVVGLEALARWHRSGRLVEPAEWWDVADEEGLVALIGFGVLRAARGVTERSGLPVAVNVAPSQVEHPGFVAAVEEAWGEGLWDRLTLEITESEALGDLTAAERALSVLAARGVRIAIDDFGTGFNSLARLGTLPLHVLKVDRAFVQRVVTTEGAAVVQAIVSLARAHRLDVVAEGVEEPEQLAALSAMGVPTVQGFLLGRPSPRLPRRAHVAPAVGAGPPRRRTGVPLSPAASA